MWWSYKKHLQCVEPRTARCGTWNRDLETDTLYVSGYGYRGATLVFIILICSPVTDRGIQLIIQAASLWKFVVKLMVGLLSTLNSCGRCLWWYTQFWVWAFVCRLVQVRFRVCSFRFFSVAECYMTRRIFPMTFVSHEITRLSHSRLDRDVFAPIHFWTISTSE